MTALRLLHVRFLDPLRLRPHEHHDASHAAALAESIRETGIWRVPVAVERGSLTVMDGHHRLAAALALRLARIPVLLLGYEDVPVTATRDGHRVTPEAIVSRARSGHLYPPKTTHHVFPTALPACHVSLCVLVGSPQRAATGS